MNTPAHMVLGLAVLGRRPRRREWAAILAGGFLPDAALFWEAAYGRGSAGVFVEILNSVPVWAAILIGALATNRRALALLAAAALLHVGFDLALHADDARQHFWPLSDWRLISPVSFWDADHHGRLFGVLEAALFAVCFAVIWRRLRAWWEKALAAVFAALYALTFVHFVGHGWFGQHWAVW